MLNLVRRVWPQLPGTWQDLWRGLLPALVEITRLTAATVIAYILTVLLIPGPVDLTGALTALLVLQASANGSVKMGLVRVGAVVVGVGVALGVSLFVGLHWYSLFLVVFVALVLARVFRLGDQSLETAISAMLILGSTTVDMAAGTRVLTTLVGTAVGVIFPFVIPPRVPLRDAADSLADVGGLISGQIKQISEQMSQRPICKADSERWLSMAREVTTSIGPANQIVEKVNDVQRWNVTSLSQADAVPLLRSGLDTLEASLMTLRSLLYTLNHDAPFEPHESEIEGEVRQAFAYMIATLGDAIDSYAQLLRSEALDANVSDEAYEKSVDDLHEARAILTEMIMIGASEHSVLLRPTVLAFVDQILLLLDRETQRSSYDAWKASQLGYKLPGGSIGPQIRGPRGRSRQRQLRARAQESRERFGDDGQLHSFDDDSTLAMDAIAPRASSTPESDPGQPNQAG